MCLKFTLMEQEVRNGFTLAGLCPPSAEQCYAAGSLPLLTLRLKPWSGCCCTLNYSDMEKHTLDWGVGGD